MHLAALRHPNRLSIRARIALLVVACILPASILAAIVTYLSYDRERSNIRVRALTTTRALMHVVERDLAANVAAMQTLSHSAHIDRGNPAVTSIQERRPCRTPVAAGVRSLVRLLRRSSS